MSKFTTNLFYIFILFSILLSTFDKTAEHQTHLGKVKHVNETFLLQVTNTLWDQYIQDQKSNGG